MTAEPVSRLVDANMDALKAVAHQAGLGSVDLKALARVIDAAMRIASADERERFAKAVAEALPFCMQPAVESLRPWAPEWFTQ